MEVNKVDWGEASVAALTVQWVVAKGGRLGGNWVERWGQHFWSLTMLKATAGRGPLKHCFGGVWQLSRDKAQQ